MAAQDSTAAHGRPFRTAARYYGARAPYSRELRPALSARLGWNGEGRLLDVGCGPGVLALELASSFAEVVGVDPEEAMLSEGRAMAEFTKNIAEKGLTTALSERDEAFGDYRHTTKH